MDKKSSAFKKMMDKTRQIRKTAEENSAKFEKVDWFIPAKGDNNIRILPGIKNEEDFFVQVRTHFMPIKKKDGSYTKIPVRCLLDFEEDCPICKAFTKMVKSDNAKTKEEANWLRPSTKFLVNVINYQERKVQPYAMALSVFNSITGWMDELGTPIFDVEEGRDFKVIKKVKGGKTEYEVRPSMKDSAIPEKLRPLMEGASDLSELYKTNERTKMEEYTDSMNLDDDGEEEDDDSPKARAQAAAAKAKAKMKAKEEEVEDDEDEDEDEEETPKSKSKSKASAKADDDLEDEDEDKDEDEEDEDEEETRAAAKASAGKKSKTVASKKKSVKDDDDEDFGVDLDDEDLEKEFEDLNV